MILNLSTHLQSGMFCESPLKAESLPDLEQQLRMEAWLWKVGCNWLFFFFFFWVIATHTYFFFFLLFSFFFFFFFFFFLGHRHAYLFFFCLHRPCLSSLSGLL